MTKFRNSEIRKLAESNKGKLPFCTRLGGYPLYYVTQRNSVLCDDCANANDEGYDPVSAYDIHWEGAPLICDECGREIESAYGDPWADE